MPEEPQAPAASPSPFSFGSAPPTIGISSLQSNASSFLGASSTAANASSFLGASSTAAAPPSKSPEVLLKIKCPLFGRPEHSMQVALDSPVGSIVARLRAELDAGDAPMTLEASTLARRSLHACVADVFASERERDLEHTLRGYDDELHALDATEREKRIGDIATELFELRKAREESTSPEEEVVSAEFDVLFESHEKMAIDIAGQSLVVEKKQLSTWRFLSPLDEPEWRVCKIF